MNNIMKLNPPRIMPEHDEAAAREIFDAVLAQNPAALTIVYETEKETSVISWPRSDTVTRGLVDTYYEDCLHPMGDAP